MGKSGFEVGVPVVNLLVGCLSIDDGVGAGSVDNSGFDVVFPSFELPLCCLSTDDAVFLNDGAGSKAFSGFLVSVPAVIGTLLSGFSELFIEP